MRNGGTVYTRKGACAVSHVKRISITVVCAVAVVMILATPGCVESGPPAETPSIRGTVVTIDFSVGGSGSFLVEGEIEPDTQYDRASVSVTGATRWYGADGRPAESGVLAIGSHVEVWFEGPVAESYPVQATAGAVKITR